MKKILAFFIGLYIGLIIFMPKNYIFFTLQKKLSSQNIYINTTTNSNILKLTLTNSKIYINEIPLIKIDLINFYPFIFYNKIDFKNININFENLKIDTLKGIYSILNPIKIYIEGKSNFGLINGEIDIFKRFIKIYIKNPSNNIKNFLNKDNKGYYFYEKF